MNQKEKAKIILEHLDTVIQVDWNFSKIYLSAIEDSLDEIEKEDKKRPLNSRLDGNS